MSLFSRSEGQESASKLYRIKNSLTAGGYLTLKQFNDAVETLQRLEMAESEGFDNDRMLRISGHGRTWLLANFLWVRGDVATLQPNDEAWVMTPPEHSKFGAKK